MSEQREHERAVAECLLASYDAAVPPAAQAVACEHLTDLLGVMLAGARHPSTLALLGTLPAQAPTAGACGQSKALSIQHAALFNAFAAPVDDFDDDDTLLILESSYGNGRHRLSGAGRCAEFVRLSAGGSLSGAVETIMRLGPLVNPRHYLAGWHATCTLGVVGAVAASGLLLGLAAGRLRHALGFTASIVAGLRSNFGSDTKRHCKPASPPLMASWRRRWPPPV